jgi:hypothetical protein
MPIRIHRVKNGGLGLSCCGIGKASSRYFIGECPGLSRDSGQNRALQII